MKVTRIIGLAVLAVFVSLLFVSQMSGNSYYTDFRNAEITSDKVHIVARWVNREQSFYDPKEDVFHFYAQDTLNNIRVVQYPEPKPVNFETADRIVMEGRFEGGVFKADYIYLKCPSKYEAKGIEAEKGKDI